MSCFQDTEVLRALEPWQVQLEEQSNRVVGTSRVYLQQAECARGECNLGNFYTDAMLYAVRTISQAVYRVYNSRLFQFVKHASSEASNWSNVSIALTSQGNFRVPIPAGSKYRSSSKLYQRLDTNILPLQI